ncbi:hypothetical protein HZB07_00565 [Candidatus Saganbacteria bacterium]|nr:hypothetical protein [Candidatus Saganbacteria bacterium]
MIRATGIGEHTLAAMVEENRANLQAQGFVFEKSLPPAEKEKILLQRIAAIVNVDKRPKPRYRTPLKKAVSHDIIVLQ